MLTAILVCGLLVTSCAREDNVAGGTDQGCEQGGELVNIEEPTDFAEYINSKVYVGDNFYTYAVGKWQDNNPLIGNQSRNGTFHLQ